VESENKVVDFFLGANSPKGFAGYFSELSKPDEDYREFVIKGGPGTGKSSFMQQISDELKDKDDFIERIHCSSDANSLDGVICHKAKVSIADGTAPHIIEPSFPGAYQTVVNFSEFWNEDSLYEKRVNIRDSFIKNKKLHERCCRFLQAANSLLTDSYLIALDCTDSLKIAKFAKRLAQREFGSKKGKGAKENIRLLSAVTPSGVKTYFDTVLKMCDKVFVIKDDFGASSRILLSVLRKILLESGHEIYTCYCPLNPNEKIDHIIIPELSIGFVTTNKFVVEDFEPYRVINFSRFTDIDRLKLKKQRLSFNKKAATELIEEAVSILKMAKASHDELEKYYIQAINFDQVDYKQKEVLEKILQRYKLA
jgi:hypothetical protein